MKRLTSLRSLIFLTFGPAEKREMYTILQNNTLLDAILQNILWNFLSDAILQNILWDAILKNNFLWDAILQNNFLSDAILHNNILSDAIQQINFLWDTILQNILQRIHVFHWTLSSMEYFVGHCPATNRSADYLRYLVCELCHVRK